MQSRPVINVTQVSELALLHENSANFANGYLALFLQVDTNSNSFSNTGIEVLIVLSIMVWKVYEFCIVYNAAMKWTG